MPVGPSRDQWVQYQREAAVNGPPPGGARPRPPYGDQPARDDGSHSPPGQSTRQAGNPYTQWLARNPFMPRPQASNPYTQWQEKWAGRAQNPAAYQAMMAERRNLEQVYGSQWNNWEAAANAYMTVISNGQRRQFRTLDEYNRWMDSRKAENKLTSAQYAAQRDNAQRTSNAANMRQQMLSEQARQATRDRVAGYKADRERDQLMQMLMSLIGNFGGGNQITPPGGGGGSVGPYNLRPPQPGGYIQP